MMKSNMKENRLSVSGRQAFHSAAALFWLLAATGCGTFDEPWAPPLYEENRTQLFHFYDTHNWPYTGEFPPIQITAQFMAGLPALPFILGMFPFVLFSDENPTRDPGVAILQSERKYMEYPGYALYRVSGYPLYLLKEGVVWSSLYVYHGFDADAGEQGNGNVSAPSGSLSPGEDPDSEEELDNLTDEDSVESGSDPLTGALSKE
jgi:hypothetical protein